MPWKLGADGAEGSSKLPCSGRGKTLRRAGKDDAANGERSCSSREKVPLECLQKAANSLQRYEKNSENARISAIFFLNVVSPASSASESLARSLSACRGKA